MRKSVLFLSLICLTELNARITDTCRSLAGDFAVSVRQNVLPPSPGEYTVRLKFEAGKEGFSFSRPWLEDIERSFNAEKMTESIRGEQGKNSECDAGKTPLQCLDSLDLVAAHIDSALESISRNQVEFAQKEKALRCAQERLMEYALKVHATAAAGR